MTIRITIGSIFHFGKEELSINVTTMKPPKYSKHQTLKSRDLLYSVPFFNNIPDGEFAK